MTHLTTQSSRSAMVTSAIVMVLLGIASLFVPAAAGIGIAVVFGATILLAGFAYGVAAFAARGTGALFLRILASLAFTAAGIYLLAHPTMALSTLTLIVATVFLIEGVAEAGSFFALRPLVGSSFLLLNAFFSFLLAFLIFQSWPASSVWTIGTLVGIDLITNGITRLLLLPQPSSRLAFEQ